MWFRQAPTCVFGGLGGSGGGCFLRKGGDSDSESDSESRLVLVTRMAMYTRSIDSNWERGRYISRVGRASSFLSLTRWFWVVDDLQLERRSHGLPKSFYIIFELKLGRPVSIANTGQMTSKWSKMVNYKQSWWPIQTSWWWEWIWSQDIQWGFKLL